MIPCRLWLAGALLMLAGACRTTYEFPERTVQTSAAGLTLLELTHSVGSIQVECRGGSEQVEIRSTTRVRTQSRSRAEEIHEAYRLEVTRAGETLKVRWPEEAESMRAEVDTDLVVLVPSTLQLSITNGVGDVEINGADRDVTAITAIGDIDVHARGSSSIRALTRIGDIDVEGDPDSLNASSEIGNVEAWTGADLDEVELGTKIGDVTLYLADNLSPLSFSASTTIGTVTPLRKTEDGTRPGPTVTLHTSTGDVAVHRNRRRSNPKFY